MIGKGWPSRVSPSFGEASRFVLAVVRVERRCKRQEAERVLPTYVLAHHNIPLLTLPWPYSINVEMHDSLNRCLYCDIKFCARMKWQRVWREWRATHLSSSALLKTAKHYGPAPMFAAVFLLLRLPHLVWKQGREANAGPDTRLAVMVLVHLQNVG